MFRSSTRLHSSVLDVVLNLLNTSAEDVNTSLEQMTSHITVKNVEFAGTK
jgi:hypothetical protein